MADNEEVLTLITGADGALVLKRLGTRTKGQHILLGSRNIERGEKQ